MVQAERRRGTAYAWVMRLRPDMGYTLAFPPLEAWPKPKRPMLFADYISSGSNDTLSPCGPSETIDRSMMLKHGVCADDTFGFMNRQVSTAYFRHWFWKTSCGGTSKLPRNITTSKETHMSRPVGHDGRLGCIECRLGCAMHVANVGVAALPDVALNRRLVRLPPPAKRGGRSIPWLPLAGDGPKPAPTIEMRARSFQPTINKIKKGRTTTAQLWKLHDLVL